MLQGEAAVFYEHVQGEVEKCAEKRFFLESGEGRGWPTGGGFDIFDVNDELDEFA